MRNFEPRSLHTLLVALLLMSPSVSAEIFKCIESKDVIKLQNFPCSMDSMGWVPTVGSAAATPSSAGAGARAASAIHTLRAMVPTGEEPNGDEPYLGMTMDKVRAGWGDPKGAKEINGIEIWFYDGPRDSTRGVRFDRNGRVIGIGDEDWQPGSNGS
jgi:hypothetical protein